MHILYLEDSDFDIDYVQRYVNSLPDCQFTSTKATADALVSLQHHHPDIFLVDIMINGQPAFNVIEMAAAQNLARHIIAVTARALPSEVDHYQSLGCTYVIAKPFTIDVLDRVFAQIA